MITIDTLNEDIEDRVRNNIPISGEEWLDLAQRINALLGNEQDRLCELQEQIAQIKVGLMEDGATAAKANIYAEALPVYKEMRKQKAKIDLAIERIRLAKHQARMRTEEARGYR